MGTTGTGLQYPEGTDKVKDGDDSIRSLAQTLDPAWLDPAWQTGWVALSLNPAKYRLIGSAAGSSGYVDVELTGSAYFNGGIPTLSSVLKIPRGFTTDDTYPYAVGCVAYASSRGSTFAASTAYLDLRANGTLVSHITPASGIDCLHLEGVRFRVRSA